MIGLLFATVLASQGPELKAQGPLAGLPSPPGAHAEKLKALDSDAWLELGPPAADPKWGKARGRSWTPKMAFAPDLGGAFLCATGVHGYVKPDGHYMDDLWFYDLNAHRWICLYPGAHAKTLQLKLDKNGFEVDDAGNAVPVSYLSHGYNNLTYNPDLRRYMVIHTQCPWWDQAIPQRYDWLGIPKEKRTYGNAGPVVTNVKHPWFYNVTEGKWARGFIEGPGPEKGRYEGVLEYVPAKKQAFYLYHGDLWCYDFSPAKWTKLPGKPLYGGYDAVACLDTRRSRIYLGFGEKGFWTYDVATNAWSEPKGTNTPAVFGSCNYATMTYDSVNDVVVLNVYRKWTKNQETPPGLWIYDPAANAWSAQVKPLPKPGLSTACTNAFYDPGTNAHYFHAAGDSSDNGSMWVYRYRRQP